MPSTSADVVTCNGGEMYKVNACVAVADNASVTCTVKLLVPLLVGVPEITLLGARVRPAGKEPDINDQPYGGWPPVAASAWL